MPDRLNEPLNKFDNSLECGGWTPLSRLPGAAPTELDLSSVKPPYTKAASSRRTPNDADVESQ